MSNINRFFTDIKKYMPYTLYASKCKLKSGIVDSRIGWLWWLIEPICYLLIYVFIFGHLFNDVEEYYPLNVFIGISVWTFVFKSVKGNVNIIRRNTSLLNNIYIPKYMLVIQTLLVNGLKMIINLFLCILLAIYYELHLSLKCLIIIPILISLFIFIFGLSCILMHAGVFLTDLDNSINIFLRLWFYISGVFFSFPQRFTNTYSILIFKLNPIAIYIEEIRELLIYDQIILTDCLLYWFVFSVFCATVGIMIIYKYEESYLKVS